MSVIDEVKQRTDIVEVISQYATLTKAGRTFRALCPFHSEKHPSFFVYPEQQSWHCFGACNTGGDVFSFVMKKQGIDFGETLRLLAEKAGVAISSRFEAEAEGKEKERLYQVNEAATQYFHNLLLSSPAGEKTRDYVASRGLSLETIANFQLGFSPNSWEALKQYLAERGYSEDELLTAGLVIEAEAGRTHDRFRNRLMFPIYDIRGHVIGFGARALDDSLPKYLNSPQTPIFDKSSSLYAINLAKEAIKQQAMAVIVEGYTDVITAHQNGFHNVVASMGTSVTEEQISMVRKVGAKVITFALDADVAGKEALLRAEETARRKLAEDSIPVFYRNMIVTYANVPDTEIKVFILPEGKDPDDVIKEDSKTWQQLLQEALPIIDYTFDVVTSKLDLTTAKGKSLVVDELGPIVGEIKDIVRRAHYVQKLARLVRVSERSLEAALRRTRARRSVKEPAQEAVTHALHPLLSSRVEEYCLALLLQHPELKAHCQSLLPEYFENSENREIFIAYMRANEVKLIKEELDSAFYEYINSLIEKSLPPASQAEPRSPLTNCILRLQEKFLRNLESMREAVLALEAESGGTAAELAKQREQGIEVSTELREVFAQRVRGSRSKGDKE